MSESGENSQALTKESPLEQRNPSSTAETIRSSINQFDDPRSTLESLAQGQLIISEKMEQNSDTQTTSLIPEGLRSEKSTNGSEAEKNKETDPEDAILVAMDYATRKMVIDYLNDEHPSKRYYGSTDVEEILKTATAGECVEGSKMVARYIKQNSNLFSETYQLIGIAENHNRLKRLTIEEGIGDERHMYILFKAKNNKIYACSPANYGEVEPDFLSTIYVFPNMEEAHNYISMLEGGNWDRQPSRLWPQETHDNITQISGFKTKSKRVVEDPQPRNQDIANLVDKTMDFIRDQDVRIIEPSNAVVSAAA